MGKHSLIFLYSDSLHSNFCYSHTGPRAQAHPRDWLTWDLILEANIKQNNSYVTIFLVL